MDKTLTVTSDDHVVEVRHLSRVFDVSPPLLDRLVERAPRQVVHAVDDVSFAIDRATTFALVGESGCGKSTVARLIAGLYAPSGGTITYGARAAAGQSASATIARQRLQMIFQDPYASLNPRWRVGDIIAEPLVHGGVSARRTAAKRVAELLELVGLAEADARKYPHEFSGGQRQRISIARALAGNPDFIICDEPTSALDVSVQAQILNLMKDLQRDLRLTYLFISHDLAVVYQISDEVAVMYLGRLCERAPTQILFERPQHPYTRLLLETIPRLRPDGTEREPISGEVPSPVSPPAGCAFHPRCPFANERCRRERPAMRHSGESEVACHAVEEKRLFS
jgi:peptide/nickel transport system ATP-binding protein